MLLVGSPATGANMGYNIVQQATRPATASTNVFTHLWPSASQNSQVASHQEVGGHWILNSDLRLWHPRNWHTYLQFDRIHVLQDEGDRFRGQQSWRKSSCRFNPSLRRLSMAASSITIFLNVSPISATLLLQCSSCCTPSGKFQQPFLWIWLASEQSWAFLQSTLVLFPSSSCQVKEVVSTSEFVCYEWHNTILSCHKRGIELVQCFFRSSSLSTSPAS